MRFERSWGLDTAQYKNLPFFYLCRRRLCSQTNTSWSTLVSIGPDTCVTTMMSESKTRTGHVSIVWSRGLEHRCCDQALCTTHRPVLTRYRYLECQSPCVQAYGKPLRGELSSSSRVEIFVSTVLDDVWDILGSVIYITKNCFYKKHAYHIFWNDRRRGERDNHASIRLLWSAPTTSGHHRSPVKVRFVIVAIKLLSL